VSDDPAAAVQWKGSTSLVAGDDMYWLDGILLVGMGIGALLGARSGFLNQVGRVVGVAVAFYTAFIVNDGASKLLIDYLLINTEEYAARILAFLLIFFSVYLAIYVSTRLIERFIKAVKIDSVDRLLGAIVGAGKMTLLMALLCLGLTYFPHPKSREVVSQSVVAPALVIGLEMVIDAVPSYYREQIHRGVESMQRSLSKEEPSDKDNGSP
jgi:membrane protein required for colicin V production